MKKILLAYCSTTAFMTLIDLLWIGVIAREIYKEGLGSLMADQPNFVYGALFYLIFPVGLMVFAVMPSEMSSSWTKPLTLGALFGFFAYATYDLTNLATLRDWPIGLSLIDVAWGSAVSGAAAVVGTATLQHLSAK